MLGRLVIHSRQPARELIQLGWSDECSNVSNLVTVEAPPLADLATHYDVCIIGSGAGGATMAKRLAGHGLHVLILDTGDFVAPDSLTQKVQQSDGSVRLEPPRSNEVLYRLYKGVAGQIAGGLGKVDSKLQLAIPSKRKKIPPKQTVNVCQAEVFGGGPYVNNAIHLPIAESGHRTRSTITANQFVVSAGVGATTKLLSQSLRSANLRNRDLGKRLTANIGTAVYAMFDNPIWPSTSGRPEPGVTQCFVVDKRMIEQDGKMVEEPILENWFHFPGTVALALTGWFSEFAYVMKKFNHLSMSGIVVPTKVRRSNYVDACGEFHLEFDCDEFETLLRGMRRVARIYFASVRPGDGVTLHLPTKSILMRGGRPVRIRSMEDFEWALCQIRKRGPAFVNLLTTHPQGGNALADVVNPTSFQLMTDCGERVENLTVADASIFPAGCEINPQLTLKALATLAAQQVIQRAD